MVLREGRTRPLVLGCRPLDQGQPKATMVVKARGCPEISFNWQLVAELVGNSAAKQAGIHTPDPCVVLVSPEAAQAINKSLSQESETFRVEPGWAAGCRYIERIAPWTDSQSTSHLLKAQARTLFAFDMLTQNPDRRKEKVNCAMLRGELLAFDFEMCFSHLFLPIVGGTKPPWDLLDTPLARNHLFQGEARASLVGKPAISEVAKKLSPEWWREIRQGLPQEWHGEADIIGAHLRELHDLAQEFEPDYKTE